MKTKYPLSVYLLLMFSLCSCERVKYFPDSPVVFEKTCIIAHRGTGMRADGNTLQGCIIGFTRLEGVECDIQRSKENTIWIDHSASIESCGSKGGKCFASLSDNQIVEVDSCLGPEKNYSKLEQVFAYMATNCPDKYISLDVKAWQPCEVTNLNIIRQMDQMADAIIVLTSKYHLENRVMVESETGDFLYYVMKNTNSIATYLTTNGDFDLGVSRALDAGFTGISIHYDPQNPFTKDQIELIHRKGLRIQLWTINDSRDINTALELLPDFIQTDNLDFLP